MLAAETPFLVPPATYEAPVNVTLPKLANGTSELPDSKSCVYHVSMRVAERLWFTGQAYLDDPLGICLAQRAGRALVGESVAHRFAGGEVLQRGGTARRAVGDDGSPDHIAGSDGKAGEGVAVEWVPGNRV